jgi:hypothetical protein
VHERRLLDYCRDAPCISAVPGPPLRDRPSSYVAPAEIGADRQLHLKR